MATPRLGLVVEDKPTELSCNFHLAHPTMQPDSVFCMFCMRAMQVNNPDWQLYGTIDRVLFVPHTHMYSWHNDNMLMLYAYYCM